MSLLRWVPHRGTLPPLPPPDPGGPTPVVLLHGLMGSPGNFAATAEALLERGIPVVAPLYGDRGTVAVETSFRELLDATSPLPTPFDVVGHSLGGYLGLRLATARPGTVRTLVGVGACFRGLPLPPRRLVRKAIPLVMGRGASDLMTADPFPADVPEGTRVVSLVSDGDTVVPASLGEVRPLHGVRHEHLPGQATAIIDALE